MHTRFPKVPVGSILAFLVLVAACGGDVESAADDESIRPDPATPAQEAPEPEPAPEATPVPAPEPRPAPRPAQRPQPEPEPSPTPDEPVEAEPLPAPETPEPAPVEPEPVVTAPAGTRVSMVMETGVSTKENGPGDRWSAVVTEDVLGSGGLVLLPRGARVQGRVVESRESASSDAPAVLTLVPDSVFVSGTTYPITATLVEAEVKVESRDSGKKTATKVGIGAAAGAVLGKILGGDGKDALKGAVAGAAAGAAVALATKDGHAEIDEGARAVVRLDEPLVIAER